MFRRSYRYLYIVCIFQPSCGILDFFLELTIDQFEKFRKKSLNAFECWFLVYNTVHALQMMFYFRLEISNHINVVCEIEEFIFISFIDK